VVFINEYEVGDVEVGDVKVGDVVVVDVDVGGDWSGREVDIASLGGILVGVVDEGFKDGVHDCGGGEGGRSRNTSDEDLVVVASFVVGLAGVRRGGVESC
jgi:hypothetical protein